MVAPKSKHALAWPRRRFPKPYPYCCCLFAVSPQVSLSYLRSYQGMGVADLACVSGCECEPQVGATTR